MIDKQISQRTATILIVDDMPANLHILSHILSGQGHTVLVATSGQRANDILAEDVAEDVAEDMAVDLILLDVMLPDILGFDLCRAWKADPATQEIPVIFLSVRTAAEDKVHGFEAGGVDYITKPFNVQEVMSRVTAVLRQRWTEVDLRRSQEALQTLATELEERVALRNQELVQANQRLKVMDRMKDELIARIGHELRTPLSNLKLYLSLLAQGKTDRWEQYLHTLQQETNTLHALIEAMLDISHLDAEFDQTTPAPMNVNDAIYDLYVDFLDRFAQRQIELVLEPQPDLPQILASPLFLRQALTNLLVNALSYTSPQEKVTLRSGMQIRDQRSWVTITVADTGPGIPEEEMRRIFERFFRGNAAQDYTVPGIGLGLPMSQAIVEKMGGHISVESRLGQGSAFTVWLQPAGASPKSDLEASAVSA